VRLFHRQTGTTLHAYRNQLRLRAALERLTDPGVDLLDTALDLGYSSHSHFTETFRRSFGITPFTGRGNLTATRVRETGTKNEGWRHSVRPHAQH